LTGKIKYEFSAAVWQHAAPGGWHFVSVPEDLATEIRENLKWQEQGWGRLKAMAQAGNSKWETAIWFDTKSGTYLLPLKTEIRKKEQLQIGTIVNIIIWL